jgi:hypothetical protein
MEVHDKQSMPAYIRVSAIRSFLLDAPGRAQLMSLFMSRMVQAII